MCIPPVVQPRVVEGLLAVPKNVPCKCRMDEEVEAGEEECEIWKSGDGIETGESQKKKKKKQKKCGRPRWKSVDQTVVKEKKKKK